MEVQTPVPQNVTLFGEKVFKEVIKVKYVLRDGLKSNMAGVLIRRGD